jgi:hypothetical protein
MFVGMIDFEIVMVGVIHVQLMRRFLWGFACAGVDMPVMGQGGV